MLRAEEVMLLPLKAIENSSKLRMKSQWLHEVIYGLVAPIRDGQLSMVDGRRLAVSITVIEIIIEIYIESKVGRCEEERIIIDD